MQKSVMQKHRAYYQPKLPSVFKNIDKVVAVPLKNVAVPYTEGGETVASIFPNLFGKPLLGVVKGKPSDKTLTVAIVLSGGQAPGGHNVIAGLYDALKKRNEGNRLIGFVGGPKGLIDNKHIDITDDIISQYVNTGGFDMLQSSRVKIEKREDFEKVATNCRHASIDAIVVVGGDDSNTNAALLAEYFLEMSVNVQVIGVPKTIDGDLKNEMVEVSFGFDTACKTYSGLIGNIAKDADSSRKYWHFVRVMGRSASHIALECALVTQPNVCLISEEIRQKNMSLQDVANLIVDSVVKRASVGNNFGVVIIPEGIIEFIPEIDMLILQLNEVLHTHVNELIGRPESQQIDFVRTQLSPQNSQLFDTLPLEFQKQLLLDRDPHGNVQVSAIETEKLIIQIVSKKLEELRLNNRYSGKFVAVGHFFGYEGRSAFPSNFDCNYCYTLGYTAYTLIASGATGYMASVRNLKADTSSWQPQGAPLTAMINIERRHGKDKPVIKKSLVDLNGKPFARLASSRNNWSETTSFMSPGSIQYFGPSEVCDQPPQTLIIEQS